MNAEFPWATFTINVTGAFAIGFLTVMLARWLPHPNAKLLLITGAIGGYTTFSAYSFEALSLWERGGRLNAVAYVLGSVPAGLLAVVVGAASARYIAPEVDERSRSGRGETGLRSPALRRVSRTGVRAAVRSSGRGVAKRNPRPCLLSPRKAHPTRPVTNGESSRVE
ncbi:fluoride efflux transporter FluC [Gemmata palustris]|uniref:fluoride efflux transporter FluC n=1 Tax=Gemmata palustris TaxID=2822762 RepID=UPI001FECBCF3